jgi:hypothetical protein
MVLDCVARSDLVRGSARMREFRASQRNGRRLGH